MRQSSITKLPPKIKKELNRILADGSLTLDMIVEHLKKLGAEVSRSAVHRYAQNYEEVRSSLRQSREVVDALVADLGPDATDSKQGRILVEMLRTLAYDVISKQMTGSEEPIKKQDFFFLAKSMKELAQANRLDQDFEQKIREQIEKETTEKAVKAAETACKKQGLNKEQAAFIRAEILGIEVKNDS
ncbi:MAG: DUF3486 family protein [Alphaproteobacteria bacterium]